MHKAVTVPKIYIDLGYNKKENICMLHVDVKR